MPAGRWFRPKSDGRGFTPNDAAGWSLTLGVIAAAEVLGSYHRRSGAVGWLEGALQGALFLAYLLVVSASGGRTIWN